MSTSHEPAYSEDGMPKERYRLYHAEKAKGGMALTMTAGSAIVSRDSPAAFGNLHAYRDEIVPWLERAGGRLSRTRLQGDDPAHPSRPPHRLEQGRLAAGAVGLAGARAGAPFLPQAGRGLGPRPHRRRLCECRGAHAGGRPRRHRVRGLRPSAGRLLVAGHQPARRRLWRLARQPPALHLAGDRRGARRRRSGFHRRHPHGRRRGFREGPVEGRGRRDRAAAGGVAESSISSTSSAARSRPTRR